MMSNNTVGASLAQTVAAMQDMTKQLHKTQMDAGVATQTSHEPDRQHFQWVTDVIELDTCSPIIRLMTSSSDNAALTNF